MDRYESDLISHNHHAVLVFMFHMQFVREALAEYSFCTPLPWQWTVSVGVINPMQGEYIINMKLWLSILAHHDSALREMNKILMQGLSCCHGEGIYICYDPFSLAKLLDLGFTSIGLILYFACSP